MLVPRRDHRRQDGQALLDAELEAHLAELDADVRVEPIGGDALDGLHVRRRRPVGRRAVLHRLAEHVERRAGTG